MKPLRAMLVALCLSATPALAADAIPPDARAAIDAGNAAWVPALEAGDVRRACTGFADGALVVGADGSTQSIAAFEAHLKARFAGGFKVTGGIVKSLGAHLVNGEIVEWGSSLLVTTDKTGVSRKGGGYYLAVWSKGRGGAWKITRNISLGPDQS
jgi:ketosteroid isomerase-like protein